MNDLCHCNKVTYLFYHSHLLSLSWWSLVPQWPKNYTTAIIRGNQRGIFREMPAMLFYCFPTSFLISAFKVYMTVFLFAWSNLHGVLIKKIKKTFLDIDFSSPCFTSVRCGTVYNTVQEERLGKVGLWRQYRVYMITSLVVFQPLSMFQCTWL